MVKGNAGLVALCVLLGGAAFAVLFVAPRYFDGEETLPPKVVAEAGKSAGPGETPDVGDAPDADAAKVEDAERAESVADESGPGEKAAEAAPAADESEASETAEADDAAPRENTDDAASDAQAENAPADETAAAPAEAQQTDVVPAFDVLRVEPDGSMVVAGRAEPGSKVEIVNGDDVLASTEAGPAGNFAAVLDEPLAPGDYQIALRASNEDGEPIDSEETATVSVPSGNDDELLALVTRPGEATRIVTAPEADEGEEAAGDDAAATAEAEADGAAPTADAEKSAAPAPDNGPAAADSAEDKLAEEDAEQSVATAGDQPAVDTKAGRPVAGDAASEDDTDTETAALGEAEPAAGSMAAQDTAKGDRPSAEAIENVRIDAVEVEGDQLYVTGSAEPGATVGIYVDNVFAGAAEVSDEGRFLVEERMPMTVGEHTIRADMTLDGEVVARAIVPFTRPDEGTAAAVARADRPEDGSPAETDVGEPAAAVGDEDDAPVSEATREPAESAGEPAEIARGSAGAAAEPSAEPSPSVPEPGETVVAPADGGEAATEEPELAAREEVEETEPASSPSDGSATTLTPDQGPSTPPSSEEPAASSPAVAEGDADTIVTLRQEPLEPTDSSVIIRRGDTLWEISRRVYGRGVRYTTIYLANDDQIANPDLILPGQVFSVPVEALENAEELHRQRLQAGRER